jgi:hypothetical protein
MLVRAISHATCEPETHQAGLDSVRDRTRRRVPRPTDDAEGEPKIYFLWEPSLTLTRREALPSLCDS